MRIIKNGLIDVESWSVKWLGDELVCGFKQAVNVIRGGIWHFVNDTNRPAFLESELVGLCVNGNWQVWFRHCVGETVSVHMV